MVRATIPMSNYESLAREQFRQLRLSVDDLLDKQPSEYLPSDRRVILDGLRMIMERLAKYDAGSQAYGNLSPGAQSLLRSLAGSQIGDYTTRGEWMARFATPEAAEAAARELSSAGMINVHPMAAAVTLTPFGASTLGL